METYANGMVEDEMISSLSFKIDPTANYVTSRQSVTYQAQGSNIYQSGAGSKVIRFNITGTGQYLDPSTVRFIYTLVNKEGANFLFPHRRTVVVLPTMQDLFRSRRGIRRY